VVKNEFLVNSLNLPRNYLNFSQKSKFYSKTEILVKNRNFTQTSKIFYSNIENFSQNLKLKKNYFLVKNLNLRRNYTKLGQKLKFPNARKKYK